MSDLMGHADEVGFYVKYDRKPLEYYKPVDKMI